jgi:uncharacterized protein (TIGR03435 family)
VAGPGQSSPNFCDYPDLGRKGQNRTLNGNGIGVADLANAVARAELHKPFIDRTGLTGTLDVHLEWTPDSAARPGADPSDDLSCSRRFASKLD